MYIWQEKTAGQQFRIHFQFLINVTYLQTVPLN